MKYDIRIEPIGKCGLPLEIVSVDEDEVGSVVTSYLCDRNVVTIKPASESEVANG